MISRSVQRLTVRELLKLHGKAVAELRRRGVVRSANNPVADYAEALVRGALALVAAPPSSKGYDALDAKGRRFEIKARRQAAGTKPTRFSAIRDLDGHHFHYLALVLFSDDYGVERGAILTTAAVRRLAFYQEHVNGWIVPLGASTWTGSGVRDITEALRQAQLRL